MRRLRTAVACGVLALCGACGHDDANAELASELRALRLQLRTPPAATAVASDQQALAAALAPLRDVLAGLADSQRELQGKQLALTQELQRWSQLLVESTVGAHKDQSQALGARLQVLETALQEQGERHRQVEALLQGALDRTADRLEDFLKRLNQTVAPAGAPVAPLRGAAEVPVPGPASVGGTPELVKPEPGGVPAGGAAPGGGVQSNGARQAGSSPWLWSLLALGALSVSVVCWRAAVSSHRRAARFGAEAEAPIGEPATQDLWEAAALLGEVVGRLRAAAVPGEPVTAVQPAVQSSHVSIGEIEDLFVLEEEPELAVAPAKAAPTVVPPVAQPTPPRRADAPAAVTCLLRPRDRLAATDEVLRILAADPRVLRRPAPTLTPRGATLEVSFVLLPGLSAGERSQLEQRLRDAVA